MLIVKNITKGIGIGRSNLLIKIAAIVVAMVVALSLGTVSTYADDSGVNSKPTLKQLRDKYNEAGTPPLGEATFATPVNTSEYTPATLTQAAYTYAENYLNFMRYQAGVGPITLDNALNANAAQGALIMARNGVFGHVQNIPDGITEETAKPGRYACITSNLSWSTGSSFVETAIQGQMNDQRPESNVECLGHRRWLINPSTSTLGFGSARVGSAAYTAIRVFNYEYNSLYDASFGNIQSNNSTNYTFCSWPASGYMLNEVFDSRTPWSIILNTSKYNRPTNSVNIEITRQSDSKKWTLNSNSPNTFSNGYIDSNYFFIAEDGYGEGYCLVFCPNPNELGSGKLRDNFDVKVTGLSSKNTSTPSTIQYTVMFKGLKPNLDEMSVSLNQTSMEYTGQGLKPTASVNYDGTILTEGTDYQITYSNNINVTNGGATATITGKGAYEGSVQKTFSITPKALSSSMVTLRPTSTEYNGSKQAPMVTVKDGNRSLMNGTDYTLTNDGGTDVGNYNVIVAGKGNYSGTVTRTYRIDQATNKVTITYFEIDGRGGYKWDIKSTFGAKTVVLFFDVSPNGKFDKTELPKTAGTVYAKAYIPGTRNYTGAWSPVKDSTPISGKVTILNTIANSAKRTNDVIWDKSKVKNATNYELSWRPRGASKWVSKTVGNTVRGTTTGLTIKGLYEIRVRPKNPSGAGAWSKSVYRYFHTTEKIRLSSNNKGSFTMSWKRNPDATSYQVMFTTNSNGAGAAQNINTVGASATSFTKTGLKSGVTYYVQVREIRKVGNINYIGNISCPVAVKIK